MARKARYTREGRMLLDRGKRILFLERELDATGNCPITAHQADLLAERIVQLLNGGK
jgi:hypothetical protein